MPRALIVDDGPEIVDLLRKVLTHTDYEVQGTEHWRPAPSNRNWPVGTGSASQLCAVRSSPALLARSA